MPQLESRRITGQSPVKAAGRPAAPREAQRRHKQARKALQAVSPNEMLRWIRGMTRHVPEPCPKSTPLPVHSRAGHLIEVLLPPEHEGFRLGGRSGIVADVYPGPRALLVTDDACADGVAIKRGWKLLGCNRTYGDVFEVMDAMGAARRAGGECRLAFEVGDQCARSLGRRQLRQSRARLELDGLLQYRPLAALDALSEPQRTELLHDVRFQVASTAAGAVFELEVLLGLKTAACMAQVERLFAAVKWGDPAAVQELASSEQTPHAAFLQRDGAGNVALHHARDAQCAALLLQREPKAQAVRNFQGQTPIETLARRHPAEAHALVRQLAPSGRLDVACAFRLDDEGVSLAMRLTKCEGFAALVERHVASWGVFEAALRLEAPDDVLRALQRSRPPGLWREVLAYHCFGEERVWARGCHTGRSRTRLPVVWQAMRRAFRAAEARRRGAAEVLRGLLAATQGPRRPKFDPREPYRAFLWREVCRSEALGAGRMADAYAGLAGDDAAWLEAVEDFVSVGPSGQPLAGLGLPNEGLRSHVEAPGWLDGSDMRRAFQDLAELGAVGDAATDRVAEFVAVAAAEGPDAGGDGADWAYAAWFAAWLRGLRAAQRGEVSRRVRDGAGPGAVVEGVEAKGLPVINEELATVWEAMVREPRGAGGPEGGAAAKALRRRAAAYVLDREAWTLTVKDAAELRRVLDGWRDASAGVEVVGIRNGFARTSETDATGYRELRAWLRVCTGPASGLVVERRLTLRRLWDERQCLRVPCEAGGGGLDWPEVFEGARGLLDAERAEAWRYGEACRRRLAGAAAGELRVQGFGVPHLLHAGFAGDDLKGAGFRAHDFRAAGFEAKQLRALQFNAWHMKEAGCDAAELADAGFVGLLLNLSLFPTLPALKTAGYDATQLKLIDFEAAQLREAGFSATQLREAGWDARQLKKEGFDATELMQASFEGEELLDAGFDTLQVKEALMLCS